jgi:hypothetical protein
LRKKQKRSKCQAISLGSHTGVSPLPMPGDPTYSRIFSRGHRQAIAEWSFGMNRKRLAITAAVIGAIAYPAWTGSFWHWHHNCAFRLEYITDCSVGGDDFNVFMDVLLGGAAAAALSYFGPGLLTIWWRWVREPEPKETTVGRALRWIIRITAKGGVGPLPLHDGDILPADKETAADRTDRLTDR